MTDLAVLGPDPRFGGGGLAQTEAFWRGAVDLGRAPRLYFLAYRGLRGRPAGDLVTGESVSALPGLDGASQRIAGRRLARRVHEARSVWVVSPVASHGYAAARSGLRYGAWIGTTFADEWPSRTPRLSPARRTALAASASTLLRLERETLRRASRLFATSSGSRAAIAAAAEMGTSAIEILPIPVDIERFAPVEDAEWNDRPRLVFVGRGDDPRKNVDLLLDAFTVVRTRIPDAELVLVGRPPRRALPVGAAALGDVDDVATVLRRATIFVLPSLQEGFGVVVAEALACGVPVVTTPSRGPEELVRASGGGRVLSGFGVEELAETVSELLDNPGTLAAMRAAGREHVEREHSPERFRSLLANALQAVDQR